MQFDTKSPTPKILFSASGIVPEDQLDAIARQKESKEAEQAIKLTVFQTDSNAPTVAQPVAQAPVAEPVAQAPVAEPVAQAVVEPVVADIPEPTLRESDNNDTSKVNDVSDIISKWSTKE